jgi:hypothetical protein
VIEEGDRISARFTYNGAFSKAFTGYQLNSTAAQMGSIGASPHMEGVRAPKPQYLGRGYAIRGR